MKKIRFGTIHADCLTFDEAIERIVALARAREGGYVVTPNVDHIVLAETHQGLRDAYHDAALALADGMPLLWMAKAMGHPLPEKISGSDLMMPLMRRAARESLGVYLLGGMPGVADRAAKRLVGEIPQLAIVGTDAPELGFEKDEITLWQTIDKVREAKPDLVLVALGCPKQELFMRNYMRVLVPAVLIGVGASIDFIAGVQKRSPRWMSTIGFEWLHRLASDPRRLAHRYLIRDRAIGSIFVRMMRLPVSERAFEG